MSFATMILVFVTLPVGFLSAFFTYDVYRRTKGGSPGWMYIAMGGFMLGMFSVFIGLNLLMGIPAYQNSIKIAVDIISYSTFSMVFPLAGIMLMNDMGIKSRVTTRGFLIYFIAVAAMLFAYNFIVPFPGVFEEVLSLMNMMMLFTFPVLAYAAYRIGFGSGILPWKIILVASLLMAGATFSEVIISDGCGGWDFNRVLSGEMENTIPECADFPSDMIFSEVIPFGGTLKGMVTYVKYNDFIYMIAALLFIVSFFLIWKSMR